MKSFIYATIILLLSACHTRKTTQVFEGGGSYVDVIDSSLKKDIQFMLFGKSVGVVFPAEYCEKHFGKRGWAADKKFFTPDTIAIRIAVREMNSQYCPSHKIALAKFYFNINIDSINIDSAVKKKYELHKSKIEEFYKHDCDFWINNYPYYDKQFIAYTTLTGEKIIQIKLIDFRNDPNHMKPYFDVSWIEGWHGWFYSNVREEEFNLTKNTLIPNKNL
jgi:hypothetical protein